MPSYDRGFRDGYTRGREDGHAEQATAAEMAYTATSHEGAALIAAERRRQVEDEGWTAEHDAQHVHGELAQAAAYYCICGMSDAAFALNYFFPVGWDKAHGKREGFPVPTDRDLIKAGALIAAELDRRSALAAKER
jgi:hypothetical protein